DPGGAGGGHRCPQGPPATAPPAVRLGTGPTHPTQPAAVVTGLSPSAPDPRTPPAMGDALLQEPARPVRAAPPRPSGPARPAPLRPETPRRAVLRTGGSDHRNRPSLPDDASLARGGPLGTGVVEGACRHRVPERLEQSGMRWTTAGAQAVLALRAVRITGHWAASGSFHRPQHHQRVYGTSAPVPERAEAQGLPLVASCSHRPQIVVTLI